MKRGLLVAFLTATVIASAQVRQETTLTDDWQFSQDKKNWQSVSIPHDWAIAALDRRGALSPHADHTSWLRACRIDLRRSDGRASGIHQWPESGLLGLWI